MSRFFLICIIVILIVLFQLNFSLPFIKLFKSDIRYEVFNDLKKQLPMKEKIGYLRSSGNVFVPIDRTYFQAINLKNSPGEWSIKYILLSNLDAWYESKELREKYNISKKYQINVESLTGIPINMDKFFRDFKIIQPVYILYNKR